VTRLAGRWTQPTILEVGSGKGPQYIRCAATTDTEQRTVHILPPRSAEENTTLEADKVTGVIPDEIAWHRITGAYSGVIERNIGVWVDW
jgi:hypothetical protein